MLGPLLTDAVEALSSDLEGPESNPTIRPGSLWSLHVLPVLAWVLSSLLPRSKDMQLEGFG